MNKSSAFADSTSEQLALGKRGLGTLKLAVVELERIKLGGESRSRYLQDQFHYLRDRRFTERLYASKPVGPHQTTTIAQKGNVL